MSDNYNLTLLALIRLLLIYIVIGFGLVSKIHVFIFCICRSMSYKIREFYHLMLFRLFDLQHFMMFMFLNS